MISYMRTPGARIRDLDEHTREILGGLAARGEAASEDLADTLATVRVVAWVVAGCAAIATIALIGALIKGSE